MATFHRLQRTLALCAASLPLLVHPTAGYSQQPGPPAGQLPGANIGRAQPPNAAVANGPLGLPAGNNVGVGNSNNGGGAALADFDSLIDLITSTVENETWLENGTGEGDIQPFPNGVYVDAAGALRFREPASKQAGLAAARNRGLRSSEVATKTAATVAASAATPQASTSKTDSVDELHRARHASELRFVSLSKLEAAIADCQERHVPLDPEMLSLAGLQRVSYVFAYPETGDLVLAGPAGDWAGSPQGELVSLETGRPVVRLDDLLTLWRRQRSEKSPAFGCSIVPRQEALAKTQAFLEASAAQPLEPSGRRKWLAELRDTLGIQDVEYYNIDEGSRIASLLLAADYHMKLIGMGLAEGVPGVKNYLATVRNGADGSPPPMAVLRWWFSMPTSTVEVSDAHDAFALPQRCICVLSENEMLAARGERVHTGQSEDLNRKFAESFTQQFDALALKYPVYGELERVFEVALALAVIQREGLAEKVGWEPNLLLDEQRLRLPKSPAPQAVETVINHRVIGGRQIIAGVSGGVWVDGGKSLQVQSVAGQAVDKLTAAKKPPIKAAADAPAIVWWWD
ncbi:MAG: DUF1598 domain-containing protein [Planctomycetaceae bacterium]|nr:DUF1598 domain-containing protein [Planctomycetaceae bacterium]